TVLRALRAEVCEMAGGGAEVGNYGRGDFVERACAPACGGIVAAVRNAGDDGLAGGPQAAGDGEERKERGVEPVLTESGAELEALRDVDLICGVGAEVVGGETVVVAG